MAQFEIQWEAPEFEYREKDISWYWITIIVAALIIAFAVWERNFLFGFFIVIAEVMIILWGNKEPREIAIILDENGIAVGGGKYHALKEFESWSAQPIDDEWVELLFNFRARLKTSLNVMVPTAQLEPIRQNLKPILREVEHQSTLIDAIEKWLGF